VVEAEVHCHVVLVHAHVRLMFLGCQAVAPQLPLYVPSAIKSFASLDTCKHLVEYDVRLHKINTM
jgi:hypothetical protein